MSSVVERVNTKNETTYINDQWRFKNLFIHDLALFLGCLTKMAIEQLLIMNY